MFEKKLVYFAHPKSHYNTELEADCLEFIWATLGGGYDNVNDVEIEIFNPNQKMVDRVFQAKLKRLKNTSLDLHDVFDPFDFFREFARASDYVVMTSFLDGAIGSGVGDEGHEAFKAGVPVFLLTFVDLDGHNIKVFRRVSNFDAVSLNILTREETHDRNVNGEQ